MLGSLWCWGPGTDVIIRAPCTILMGYATEVDKEFIGKCEEIRQIREAGQESGLAE